ncbi:MAG: ABC transporter permease [Tunicatimonas sp.]
MFKNYLLTTLRNFRRNKMNTFINGAGLALSMACCIAIYVFVEDEYTFDSYHSQADQIYRVVGQFEGNEGVNYQGSVTYPLAKAMRNDFPDLPLVTQVVAFHEAILKTSDETSPILTDAQRGNGLTYADAYFLRMFDHPLLAGDAKTILTTPSEVVLTEKMADQLYGRDYRNRYDELLGKTLIVNQESYQISGVARNVPQNSNIVFDLLLPIQAYERDRDWLEDAWGNVNSDWFTFVLLPESESPARIESQLVAFTDKYHDEEEAAKQSYSLQALADVHTDEDYDGTIYATPTILIGAFLVMGIIVLLTACINFINLATAQSVRRAKEIGIRKTLGGVRSQLMIQFLSETFLITVLAAGVALLLADWFLAAFSKYLSVVIHTEYTVDITIIYFLVALCLVITLLAGYYPARVLSGFRPVEALKQSMGQQKSGFAGKFSLRKTLVVTQFVISQLLIIGTIVVSMQMRYLREQDLGFRQDDMAVVYVPENDRQKLEAFRNQITNQAAVARVSFSSGPPMSTSQSWTGAYNPLRGEDEKYGIERKSIDPQYLETFEITLITGRNLREEDKLVPEDSLPDYNVLINERAVKIFGYGTPEEAVGQVLMDGDRRANIVGVVQDFNNTSLQEELHPNLLYYGDWVNIAAIQLTERQSIHQLSFVQSAWEDTYPDYFYQALTMEEYFESGAMYILEDIMFQAFRIFGFLAIMIGCLGLYGLVSYLALQRQKEIGVRKVLGATVPQIVYLFSKEFTLLVLLAFVIAAPLGYFAMQAWLETFVYRIPLSITYFALALLASVGIAWVTVGYKSIRAALSNPVDALRSE